MSEEKWDKKYYDGQLEEEKEAKNEKEEKEEE